MKEKKKIVTHNGKFHPDDVFAVATILLTGESGDFEIIRSRDDGVINAGDFVLDVGGKYDSVKRRFDHHQEGGAGKRENGVPYASFGLVWKEYGEKLCGSSEIAERIDKSLVCPIDAIDNGVSTFTIVFDGIFPYTIEDFISSFRVYGASIRENDETFIKVVEEMKNLLIRQIAGEKISESLRNKVREVYETQVEKGIIVLSESLPWSEVLTEVPEPLYVVFPSMDGEGWRSVAVPKGEKSFEPRRPFPAIWAGKQGKEMAEISGVADATFCHNRRYIVAAKTKDGALALAKKAMEL